MNVQQIWRARRESRRGSRTRILAGVGLIGLAFVGAGSFAAPAADAPDFVLALKIGNVRALEAALEECPLVREVMRHPLAQQAVNLGVAAQDFALQYFAALSRNDMKKLLPNTWTYLLYPLAQEAPDAAEPDWVAFGLSPSAEKLERIWRIRVFPKICSMGKGARWTGARIDGRGAWRRVEPGMQPVWLSFASWGVVFGSKAGVRNVLARSDISRLVSSVDSRIASQGFEPGPAGVEMWIDVEASIQRTLEELPQDAKEVRDMKLLGTDALHRIIGLSVSRGNDFEERLAFFPAEGQSFTGLLGILHAFPAREPRAPGLLPAHTLISACLSIGSGERLFETIRSLVKARAGAQGVQTMDAALNMLGAQLGIDVQADVFGALGSEVFAAILSGGKTAGTLPGAFPMVLPGGVSFLGGLAVKDPDAAAHLVQKLLRAPILMPFGIEQAREQYHGQAIFTISLQQLPGRSRSGPFQVAYMFRDGFLVIAEADVLESVVDAMAQQQVLARTGAFRARSPEKRAAVLSVYADAAALLAESAPRFLDKAGPQAAPFRPLVETAVRALGGVRLDLAPYRNGIGLQVETAVPVLLPLAAVAAVDHLGRPKIVRRVKLAEARMKTVAEALRKYYRAHRDTPPDSLYQLRPAFLQRLPEDPFRPGESFAYGVAVGGGGWVLISAGPDGRLDLDPSRFEMSWWERIRHAKTPEDIATAKRLIYRFRPKQFADERAPDDEGDVVRVGKW